MTIPNSIELLIAVLLVLVCLYIIQKMVLNAARERRDEKNWQINRVHDKIYMMEHVHAFCEKEEKRDQAFCEKSEENEDDSDDGIDLDDLLS